MIPTKEYAMTRTISPTRIVRLTAIRVAVAVVMTMATMAVAAGTAQAFTYTPKGGGTPGQFYSYAYSPAIEGGICGAPGEPYICSGGYSQDQIFVNWIHAHSAPYSNRQTIGATAYLYYLTPTNGWTLYLTHSYASCTNQPGGGNGSCSWGSPSPDKIDCTVKGSCFPAFANLPQGRYYTVVIRVTWRDYYSNSVLAQADYYPAGSSDIGCAAYAQNNVHPTRCYPHYDSGAYDIAMPNGGNPGS
jgi:hypothetical protein